MRKKILYSEPSRDAGYGMFVTVVERAVCLGHFFRLRTEGGTLQRPDGKICQANRAEILLLWVMTFCWIHAENMKGNLPLSSPPEPLSSSLNAALSSPLLSGRILQTEMHTNMSPAQKFTGAQTSLTHVYIWLIYIDTCTD